MSLIEFIKPEFEFSDDRGYLKQLVSNDWSQVNVIMSEKDSFRGGHYHKYNKELFYIINGDFDLELTLDGLEEKYNIKQGDMFVINKNVKHSFFYTSDTLMVSMYDIGVEMDFGKDIFTD